MRKKPRGPSSGVLIKAAMDYGRLGWSVVPIRPQDEESFVRWQVYQHRRPETTEIGDWFTRWPDANLAIVTGIVSSLVVLDLDPRRGADLSGARLEREHGPLPETVEAESGSGGRHLYFSHPGGIVPDRIDLAQGIDLRGDGGYVVAPPSVRASGASYRWVRSPEVFHLASLPAWLSDHLKSRRDGSPDPAVHWQRLLQEGVTKGGRSDALSFLSAYLSGKEVHPQVVLELLRCWNTMRCRPPLETHALSLAVTVGQNAGNKSNESEPVA